MTLSQLAYQRCPVPEGPFSPFITYCLIMVRYNEIAEGKYERGDMEDIYHEG